MSVTSSPAEQRVRKMKMQAVLELYRREGALWKEGGRPGSVEVGDRAGSWPPTGGSAGAYFLRRSRRAARPRGRTPPRAARERIRAGRCRRRARSDTAPTGGEQALADRGG